MKSIIVVINRHYVHRKLEKDPKTAYYVYFYVIVKKT